MCCSALSLRKRCLVQSWDASLLPQFPPDSKQTHHIFFSSFCDVYRQSVSQSADGGPSTGTKGRQTYCQDEFGKLEAERVRASIHQFIQGLQQDASSLELPAEHAPFLQRVMELRASGTHGLDVFCQSKESSHHLLIMVEFSDTPNTGSVGRSPLGIP